MLDEGFLGPGALGTLHPCGIWALNTCLIGFSSARSKPVMVAAEAGLIGAP